MRLLGWLVHEKKLARPTLNAFGSVQIGPAVQLYIKFLVEVKGRKYSTIAATSPLTSPPPASSTPSGSLCGSVATSVGAPSPSTTSRASTCRCCSMARQEATFDIAKPIQWDARLGWRAARALPGGEGAGRPG